VGVAWGSGGDEVGEVKTFKLTARKKYAASCLAQGYTQCETAKKVEVTQRTICRWLKSKHFVSLIDRELGKKASKNMNKWKKKVHDDTLQIGRKKHRKSCFVYLIIASNGLVKIGRTVNVIQRLNCLQSMSPIPLKLIGYIEDGTASKIERELHLYFSDKRVRGEWFDLSNANIEFIKTQYRVF